jgi:hypothetical protein
MGDDKGSILDRTKSTMPVQPTPKQWVGIAHVGFQEQIFKYVLPLYAFAVVATFALFFLQAFHVCQLPESLLQWLGGATVGEIGGLLLLTFRAVFQKSV